MHPRGNDRFARKLNKIKLNYQFITILQSVIEISAIKRKAVYSPRYSELACKAFSSFQIYRRLKYKTRPHLSTFDGLHETNLYVKRIQLKPTTLLHNRLLNIYVSPIINFHLNSRIFSS